MHWARYDSRTHRPIDNVYLPGDEERYKDLIESCTPDWDYDSSYGRPPKKKFFTYEEVINFLDDLWNRDR